MRVHNPEPPQHRGKQSRPPIPPRLSLRETRTLRDALRAHFEERQNRLDIVATTRSPHGMILDWIPAESQIQTGERLATPPPPQAAEEKTGGRRRVHPAQPELSLGDAKLGPAGTVPIPRPKLPRTFPAVTLSRYLSKHGYDELAARLGGGDTIVLPASIGREDAPVNFYASSAMADVSFGGEAVVSLYPTYVEWSNEFSLLQTSLSNDESGTLQTLEAGVQVYRDYYGDWVPHLFVFYTTNGYAGYGDGVGGYNTDVAGWIQHDNLIFPRSTFTTLSTPGGTQYGIKIKVQKWQSNWWVQIGGRWMGYYPESLYQRGGSSFNNLGDHANRISFYGEVIDHSYDPAKTATDMGSGYFAHNRWPYTAYMRNMMTQTDRAGTLANFAGGEHATDEGRYTIESHFNSSTDWGSYMWLGGPGAR